MSLEKIVAVPGKGGLFKVIAQLRNGGFVIESLTDQKRLPVDARQGVTKLEDISVYTIDGEIPLKKVFLKMKELDAEVSKLTSKSEGADLRTTFKKLVPTFDEDRVHTSDMRKMVNWYAVLKDIVDFKEEEVKEETPAETAEVDAVAEEKQTKPKAKTPKAKKTDNVDSSEEKPVAKKRAAKKTAS